MRFSSRPTEQILPFINAIHLVTSVNIMVHILNEFWASMKTPSMQVEIWILNARKGQRDGFGSRGAAAYRWLKQNNLTLVEAKVQGERLTRAQAWAAPLRKDRWKTRRIATEVGDQPERGLCTL